MATYNVQPETNKIIKEYAESIGIDAESALDKLIITADSRRRALKKYQKSTAPKAPKAEKKAKAPKGTSLAKKKAPKAAKKAAPKGKKPTIKSLVDETAEAAAS